MPPRDPKWLPFAVFLGFFAIQGLLLLGTFDAIDLEETEYGNVAVALLDGHVDDYASLSTDPSHGDDLMSGAGRRRRTVWSTEVLVTPVFAALGPSLLSLKLFTLLGGALWALLWFLVARVAAPRAPPWLAAGLFVLPLPLIQRQALSATNLFAHLGSSLFLGAALWLILRPLQRPGSPARGPLPGILGAGLLCGFGVYQSTSLAPMLLGPLYLAWRAAGVGGALGFVGALLPGLLVMIGFADPGRDGDLASRLTGLTGGDPMRGEPLSVALENAKVALLYGAGFGRVDPSTLRLSFLPWGAAYTALSAGILAAGWPWRARPEPAVRHLRLALLLSVAAYVAAWIRTGFQLETGYFDGLRYLLPIAGVLPVLLLIALQRLHRTRTSLGLALLLAHVLGFALLFRPAVFPAPWSRLVGYEPTVMRQWMQGPLDADRVDARRLPRWSRLAGVSAARQAAVDADFNAIAARLPADGADDEGWRGVGIGLLMASSEDVPALPVGATPQEAAWITEGMAMGTAWRGCQQAVQERLLQSFDPAALWYGFGRADLYCKLHAQAALSADERGAWTRGLQDAWSREYGLDDDVDVDFLQRLYIY